tara:strand:- start:1248 stop:2687 length:1440 start_codon:yes stop_codon:yes gene_type:complete
MLKKILHSTLVIPFIFIFSLSQSSKSNDLIDKDPLKIEKIFSMQYLDFNDIPAIVKENNFELLALKKIAKAASYNLNSSIGKRYPSINLSATGLPQYLYGKNYNSSSVNTKSSEFKANPALTIRWDLINQTRGPEIEIAKKNLEIAINNYEIKKNDLIQEAKFRYHSYQKSYAEVNNAKILVDLSLKNLKDAQSKSDAGIGTEFDVLEANAQLARDKQFLEEKKILREINKISLKEILNINFEKDLEINPEQTLIGFWNYSLNKNIEKGIANNFSLRNLKLQSLIKNNQSQSFKNSNKPVIYISNTFASSFSKGSTLNSEIDRNKSSSNYSNTISLNLSWNLFDGNQNYNSAKAKDAESEAEKYNYKNMENILKKNISETYLNLKKFERKIISTKKEILSTTESLRLARLRYEVGISTLKDVLTRQKELSNARSKNISSIFNYNKNLNELERLTFQSISKVCLINKSDEKNKINSICKY